MKKLSLLLVFSVVFLFSAVAQENKDTSSSGTSDGKNWFIGAGVRGNVWVNDNASTLIRVFEKPSLGGEAFVGKWFSNVVGLRLFVDGGTAHPFFYPQPQLTMTHMEDIKYLSGRLDFMLNFTNLFRSNKTDRFYNLIPYIGPGYFHTLSSSNMVGNPKDNSIVVGVGLLNTFRLSKHLNLYANLGFDAMDAAIDGSHGDKFFKSPSKYDGLFAGSLGLVYNFGKTVKQEIVPPPVVQEVPQYALTIVNGKGSGSYVAGTVVNIAANCASATQTFDRWTGDVNNVSNTNSANTTFTMGNSNATVTAMCKDLPPKVEPPKPAPVALDPVFFRLDKSIIDPDQESKVKAAADFLNANPNAKLNVVGYADAQTANPKYNLALSQRRTQAVAKLLVTKYNVDSSRLILDWKGDTVQPFAVSTIRKNKETKETVNTNEKNRVVMFSE